MTIKILTDEQIADNMLSDIDAYKEHIRSLIINGLRESSDDRVYWDAWFRGARGVDLENAERGIIYITQDDV